MLKKTALFEIHKRLKAKIIEFSTWRMPLYYTSIVDEHNTVRNRVGLLDVSHMGEFSIKGKDALAFVQRIITNDASCLSNNQALYATMCNDRGTIIDDLLTYKFSDEHFMLVVNAANIEKDYSWIEEISRKFNKNVILKDVSDGTSLLALQGPKSQEVLHKVTDLDLAKIRYYWFQGGTVDGIPAIISRTGYTGEDGFEIYIKPEYASQIWNKILEIGKEAGIKPVGLGARDTLRLECALLLYGNDMDETRTPLEANIAWTVKFNKENFIGKEALLKQKGAGTRQRLIGFELIEPGIPRHNYPILKNKERMGTVTSGSFSPTLKKGIGLGYVKTEFAEKGTKIQIQIREKLVKAQIVKIPFYQRKNA